MNGALGASMLAAVLALSPFRVDDPSRSKSQLPLPLSGAPPAKEDVHLEIRRVFQSVERSLRQIDDLLARAEARPRATASTNVDSLLSASMESSKSVISGIDRILELADHPHPPGGK